MEIIKISTEDSNIILNLTQEKKNKIINLILRYCENLEVFNSEIINEYIESVNEFQPYLSKILDILDFEVESKDDSN